MKRNKKHPTQPDDINATKRPVTYRLIREFKRTPLSEFNTANQVVIWVVQWCQQERPVLERRRLYVRKDGVVRTYQLMGFTLEDLQFVLAHGQEIADALQC